MAKEILFIGDSLTEWNDWTARFPDHMVHNLGISGESVEMLLDRIPYTTERYSHADIIFVMTGINNVSMDDPGIIGAYRSVIKLVREAYPDAEIYVQSILPALLPWVKAETIELLNEMIELLAEDFDATYIDLYSLFIEKGLQECLLEDGIHVSAAGYEVWASAIEPLIEHQPGPLESISK